MLDRVGLERRDGRNLLVAVGIMTLLFFVFLDGTAAERAAAAVVGGLVSGVAFVVITLVINAYKPDHW